MCCPPDGGLRGGQDAAAHAALAASAEGERQAHRADGGPTAGRRPHRCLGARGEATRLITEGLRVNIGGPRNIRHYSISDKWAQTTTEPQGRVCGRPQLPPIATIILPKHGELAQCWEPWPHVPGVPRSHKPERRHGACPAGSTAMTSPLDGLCSKSHRPYGGWGPS